MSNAKRRVSPAFRVLRPVNCAAPDPGLDAIFSQSIPMMKLVPSHSPGGIDTPRMFECIPMSLLSWYHASCAELMGRSGHMSEPLVIWNRQPSADAGV